MCTRHLSQRAARVVPMLLVVAATTALPALGTADILPYSQNFEAMAPTDPGALGADGWLVYGNVFSPSMAYLYGYGPNPAPNNQPPGPPGPAFSQVVGGQGGASQGAVQKAVISDYENTGHSAGNWIESNVYQERTIGAANVGQTWYFEFDAKKGDLAGATRAIAFIKTLDPSNGYALTNFIQRNMTGIPVTWQRYWLRLTIDASLVGQLFQFGFASTATNYEPSSVFYDNIDVTRTPTVDAPLAGATGPRLELRARGNPAAGTGAQVLAFAVPRQSRVSVRVYDVKGALVTTLLDRVLQPGNAEVTWRGDDANGGAVSAGLYWAEVEAGEQRAVVKLSRLR